MVTGPYLLGIDGGTEAIRAGIFTAAGAPVAFARSAYPTSYVQPGWAEQSPSDWWAALVAAVRKVVETSEVSPHEIAGMSLACTSSTVVFCDLDGHPLRSAIIWMDVRASAQARKILATQHPALKYGGYTSVSAEWLPCKALWVFENEPELFEACPRVCEYTDWLAFQLTGQWSASINTAAIRGYHDRHEGGWPEDLFETLGLPTLTDKLPSPVLDMGAPLGTLSPTAAEELGLRQETVVAVGGADAFVAMVGLNALRPGTSALITGSSHLQLAQVESPSHGSGLFGAYTDAVVPGQYTVEGGQISTGSIVRWLRDLCDGPGADSSTPQGSFYTQVEGAAALLPPGADGVQVLDHWQGNRTPYVDADSRGMIWGLSLSHGRPHIYRAMLEAVCYGTELIFQTFAENGHPINEVVACGGAVNSELWMQIHADVSNREIAIPQVSEAGTLGAAVLAAVGAGIYPDVSTAAATMVKIDRYVRPDAAAHEAYRFYLDIYRESYETMADLMHRVSRHVPS